MITFLISNTNKYKRKGEWLSMPPLETRELGIPDDRFEEILNEIDKGEYADE